MNAARRSDAAVLRRCAIMTIVLLSLFAAEVVFFVINRDKFGPEPQNVSRRSNATR